MNRPDPVGRAALAAGAAAWLGASLGRLFGLAALVAAVLTWIALRRAPAGMLAIWVAAGVLSGWFSTQQSLVVLESVVPEGVVEVVGTVVDDPRTGPAGHWFLLNPEYLVMHRELSPWDGPRLLVRTELDPGVAAGERVVAAGRLVARSGTARGDVYAGRLTARRVDKLDAAGGLFGAANLLRGLVEGRLSGVRNRPAAALVSGFLIGDVRELPTADAGALRRAGLSHFVAVSGSNVALFLMLWWVVIGPLGFGPVRRAVLGTAGLALFVLVTRWEPSVLRAAVMAGVVLVARAAGWSIGPWTALGGGVAVLVLVSGDLVAEVGFQLSVAATGGVIAGAGVRPFPRFPRTGSALMATISAQLAVAPILLVHFGTLPLLSPLTNLLAAPLVVLSTTMGGLGVLSGFGPLAEGATIVADLVLRIARSAAPWPQIGWPGLIGVLAAGGLTRVPRLRRPLGVLVAAWAFVVVGLQPATIQRPAVVFLDVGQGDATLLLDEAGGVVLIDGGPDGAVLIERLRRYGIDRIDLMVASHEHHDHLAGLIEVVGHIPTGRLWHAAGPSPGEEMTDLLEEAGRRGVLVEQVGPGWSLAFGTYRIDVLGPVRRYASPNDRSVVLLIEAAERSILMPGDVETYAQQDLGPIRADVLKVPHQGAATSDLDWIRATGAELAVIPVGPNDYGHPADEVLAVLGEMGATIRRTDIDGDVVVSVDR